LLVGILSDSHGQQLLVRQVMALFDSLGVEHVIHCGDIGGTEVFDELAGRRCTFVWGNMDQPTGGLAAYLKTVGLEAPAQPPARLTLDGKTFAVFHGHESQLDKAIGKLQVDYLLHGHTHIPRDERIGRTRVINPGALHRAARKTVAILDTQTDGLSYRDVGK